MKFSKRKKAKMRKQRQRRIKRCCGNMIGFHIDFEHWSEVKDQATINGIVYLLVEVENNGYAIYKIVKVGNYVRLSPKRVLENQESFSNPKYWQDKSKIQITDEGIIKSVEFSNSLEVIVLCIKI